MAVPNFVQYLTHGKWVGQNELPSIPLGVLFFLVPMKHTESDDKATLSDLP